MFEQGKQATSNTLALTGLAAHAATGQSQCGVRCMPRVTYPLRAHGVISQGVDIERNEEAVEQVVGKDSIERAHPQPQDVIDVVQVVEVLCYQRLQPPTVQVAEGGRGREL